MADYEVSKIMWVAIVVALAASIFVIAKPEVQKQATGVFDKVGTLVQGINLDGNPSEGGEGEEDGHRAPGPISFDFKGLKASDNTPTEVKAMASKVAAAAKGAYMTDPLWDSGAGKHVMANGEIPENFGTQGLPSVYIPVSDIVGNFDDVKSVDAVKTNGGNVSLSLGQNKTGVVPENPTFKDYDIRIDVRAGVKYQPDLNITVTHTDGKQETLTYPLTFDFGI